MTQLCYALASTSTLSNLGLTWAANLDTDSCVVLIPVKTTSDWGVLL